MDSESPQSIPTDESKGKAAEKLIPEIICIVGFLLCPVWCLGWIWCNSKWPASRVRPAAFMRKCAQTGGDEMRALQWRARFSVTMSVVVGIVGLILIVVLYVIPEASVEYAQQCPQITGVRCCVSCVMMRIFTLLNHAADADGGCFCMADTVCAAMHGQQRQDRAVQRLRQPVSQAHAASPESSCNLTRVLARSLQIPHEGCHVQAVRAGDCRPQSICKPPQKRALRPHRIVCLAMTSMTAESNDGVPARWRTPSSWMR